MITKVNTTIQNLKNLFIEIFINKTNKVTDITENSVLNGTAFGVAKVGQKAIKDILIIEAQIFPDTASGAYLDKGAALFGVSPRRTTPLQSSTFVRVYGQHGTTYSSTGPNRTVFINTNGVRFLVEEDFTIQGVLQADGTYAPNYGYVKVRSEQAGSYANVEPNTINQVNPVPQGHIECTNEYYAIGGQDVEDDETFRARIKNNNNILSRTTIEYLTQLFQQFNPNILRVMNVGLGEGGKYYIRVITQNGIELTQKELNDLLIQVAPYFPIIDLNLSGNVIGTEIVNIEWFYVGSSFEQGGVDFRIEIDSAYDVNTVRKNIQVNLTKYLDFRYWTQGEKIVWSDLLEIVKNTDGVVSVPSLYFYPQRDETVPIFQLPRIKKFIMRDLSGNILYDAGSSLSAVFYSADSE